MVTPVLTHFCDLTVELADIMEMGDGRAGKRRIIPIIGGTVRGPKINGKILNLGADWQTVFSDGMAELDTRYAFETDDGAIIEILNFGYRHGAPEVIAAVGRGEPVDPSQYYMRTHARLETGDERYAWVNRMLFVGAGGRNRNSVEIALYAVE
ncbi:DUF3237 domain-containing protein [uncultured Roseibium sp.]|uniref:DUF3237 domain-containing protein n=1 Tax=uncultured Roseibium sp. TaxID=1936171 RepID=UPI003216C9E1